MAWEGSGAQEQGRVARTNGEHPKVKVGDVIVRVAKRYYRPAEVETLLGDSSKAQRDLGWKPRTSFKELGTEMVAANLEEAQRDSLVAEQGFQTYRYHE